MNFTRVYFYKMLIASVFVSLMALGSDAHAKKTKGLNPVTRFSAYLESGLPVTVDNASHMSQAQVAMLVLVADRSTQTGCPFTPGSTRKGLMKGGTDGDRVFVTDYYIAWFDYTTTDGVGTHTWSRAGALTGIWTLNPDTQFFKYMYEPYSPNRETPDEFGTCWNWPRNELIPGSNSPAGQLYHWDKYAPPVENTFVILKPQNEWGSTESSKYRLLATNYTQVNPTQSQWGMGSDGATIDGTVHYTTGGRMSDAYGVSTFNYTNSSNQTSTGHIDYVMDYSCSEKSIQTVLLFKSTVTFTPAVYYANIWSAYAGVGQTDACIGVSPGCIVPGSVLGIPNVAGTPYHSYNFGRVSLPFNVNTANGYSQGYAANSAASFPWSSAAPYSGFNLSIATASISPGLPIGATNELSFDSSFSGAKPYMKMTVAVPPVMGTGAANDPQALPFKALVSNYENTDQQQGMIMSTEDGSQIVEANKTYVQSYLISPVPN